MITEKAYAKINLSLDVTGKRPDGYHEVRMIMQTVDIYDTLVFEKQPEGISLDVGGSNLPIDADNLIYKAAKAVIDKCGIAGGVKISLEKHIPIAAGMAGGSSDAAAALRGVNRLCVVPLPTLSKPPFITAQPSRFIWTAKAKMFSTVSTIDEILR